MTHSELNVPPASNDLACCKSSLEIYLPRLESVEDTIGEHFEVGGSQTVTHTLLTVGRSEFRFRF